MAITPIDNRYQGFTFAGEYSGNYGVYIQDGAFYSAPKRSAETITIPGRNGAYILDNGCFENIQVTYKAFMGAKNETDFINGISAFRNMLASHTGYNRLEDDFNPSEYRMGAFIGGLDVGNLNPKTGSFDVVFECKPQRFLTVGETAVAVSSGDNITNPTLFDSSPLIEATGYGEIGINTDKITIYNIELGDISLPWECVINDPVPGLSYTYTFDNIDFLNTGDAITFSSRKLRGGIEVSISGEVVSRSGSNFTENFTSNGGKVEKNQYWASNGAYNFTNSTTNVTYYFYINQVFIYGTSSTKTYTVSYSLSWQKDGGSSGSGTGTEQFKVDYDGANTVTVTYLAPTVTGSMTLSDYGWARHQKIDTFNAYSTKSLNGTIYIDLDLGEAYAINGTQISSANNVVELPAELPALNPGANAITYDNTITSFKVTPRWWEV